MSDQNDPTNRLALRWLRLAGEDLTVARHTAADPELVLRAACTWAHQAAEKALKALLVKMVLIPRRIMTSYGYPGGSTSVSKTAWRSSTSPS